MVVISPFRYLSKEILNGFDNYKYCSIDTSPVSKYISHPFWNRVVEFVPKCIAPNVLTLSGFCLLIVNFVVSTYYDPYFYASSSDHPESPTIPNWVWLMCAVNNFLSHTLDGIDGKQARRTGSSSPLGELFDHGLDSWSTFFFPVALYSLFGRGAQGASVYVVYQILLGVMTCFILSHWEKYNTGVLFLPWGYDISQWSMSLVYLITFFYTYQLWMTPLPIVNMSMSQVIVLSVNFVFVFLSFPQTFWNVYVSYRDRTGKMLSLYESIRPLVSVITLFTLMCVWAWKSPYDILEKEPRLFYWSTSTVFSNITCRLIVSQMSATRADLVNWMVVPVVAIVTYVLVFPCTELTEVVLLWILVVISTASHLHYGICVVQEMCDHFNIYAFFIKKSNSD